jgi:hypothetical protein
MRNLIAGLGSLAFVVAVTGLLTAQTFPGLIPQDTILGRDDAGAGQVEALTAAEARGVLNVADGADVTDASSVGSAMTAAAALADLADADELGALDASDAQALKPVTWATVKSELRSELALGAAGIAADIISGHAAITAFGAGDSFLCLDAVDGLRECGFADLPGAAGGNAWSDPVDADIVPSADSTWDLGNATTAFALGYIDSVHLPEGTAPATAAGQGALYTRDTAGQPELYFREESSGDEVQLTDAGTAPGRAVTATPQNSTSGTAISFGGIPSWAKTITLSLSNVSTTGTNDLLVHIGTSGGYESTGYQGSVQQLNATANTFTTGFQLVNSLASTSVVHGAVTLTHVGSNRWVATSTLGFSNAAAMMSMGGQKLLSATLDRIQLTTVGGTDAFDGGVVGLHYDG